MKYLNAMELRKALKLAIHIPSEESDRIFFQAKREENSDIVNLGNCFIFLIRVKINI